jgi:hypothetical protein
MVPVTTGTQMVHHRVSLSLKHLSRVTCISAGGVYHTSYIVSLRDSGPAQQVLTDTGLQLGEHLILQQLTKAYFNGLFFRDYTQWAFIPHRTILGQQAEFAEEEAVLLMDDGPSHVKKKFSESLSQLTYVSLFLLLTRHIYFRFLI